MTQKFLNDCIPIHQQKNFFGGSVFDSANIKYLRINPTKDVLNLYGQSYTILKYIKEDILII